MENNDIKALIEVFKGYRELLNPIQANLHDFAVTYDSLKSDIQRLNNAFEGDIEGNLDKIYKNLSSQAERATDLSSRIDSFINMTDNYTKDASRLTQILELAEERIKALNELENKADASFAKLDETLEEKKKNYNIKELQRTIDNYNVNVQRVSEFINRDVAEVLTQNNRKLDSIKGGSDNIAKKIEEDGVKIDELLTAYKSSNELLKKVVEQGDVNESYIFEILDRWAQDRRVKTKK